jgi:hypothetical protein
MAADDPAVSLEVIRDKKPGEKVVIAGNTDLAEVTVKVIRPSGSVMYINVLKVTEGKFSDGFTLPGDAETGEYTVVVGQGDIVGKVNFKVKDTGEEPGGPGGGGGPSKPKEEPEEPTPVKKTFEDIDDYPWAKEAIETLATLGIIQGTSETTFDPSSNITRADFITLLVRMLKLFELIPEEEFGETFDDVEEGMYYYEPIGIAYKLGIVKGIGANKFNPSGQITREDLMVMVARALILSNKVTTTGTYDDISKFNDVSQVSDYAVESIALLVREGIIIGNPDNTINPKGNATRAETAVILYRVYMKYFAAEQDS